MNEEERQRLEARQLRKRQREKQRRQQILRLKLILGGIGFLVIMIILLSVNANVRSKKAEAAEAAKAAKQMKENMEAKKQEEANTLRFAAVGDNLLHDAIIEEGKSETGDWNYDFLYQNIKGDIENADLAAVNQEAPFVNNHEEAAGYPLFATPLEDGDALVKAGFDIVTQATNHAYDKGKAGILNSCSFWKNQHPEVTLLGIHADSEDAENNKIKVVKKKNFKIAMLNYTFGTNESTPVPEEESYCIDIYSEETVKEDVAKAKTMADAVIVFLHTGTEDSNEVDEYSAGRVEFLASQGVDVTICSHPHVLRKFGMMKRDDGGEMLVYYSLGNFVSTQEKIPELLEGMADFTLKKDAETGKVTITDYSMVPMVMHYGKDKKDCAVYKLSDYTEELANSHGIHAYTEEAFTLESIHNAVEPYLTPQDLVKGSQSEGE